MAQFPLKKFKIKFPKLNESTARTFQSKYESELAEASTSITLKPQGRPLGGIDDDDGSTIHFSSKQQRWSYFQRSCRQYYKSFDVSPPKLNWSPDKRTITATFAISFKADFLPTSSFDETYYSNEHESCKLVEEILKPYINKIIKQENLPVDQKSLVIMDVFTGQMTTAVLDMYKENNIEVVCVCVCVLCVLT